MKKLGMALLLLSLAVMAVFAQVRTPTPRATTAPRSTTTHRTTPRPSAAPAATANSQQLILEFFDDDGEVRLITASKANVSHIYQGMVVPVGYTIITRNSTAELRIKPNGSIIKLAANTTFQVDSLQGVQNSTVNSFSVAAGTLRAVAATTTGTGYTVRTGNAVMGVRGTDFAVIVEPGKREVMAVNKGKVEVMKIGSRERVQVGQGQKVDAAAQFFKVENFFESDAEIAKFFDTAGFFKLNPDEVFNDPTFFNDTDYFTDDFIKSGSDFFNDPFFKDDDSFFKDSFMREDRGFFN